MSVGGEVGVLFFMAVLWQLLSQGLCCQADTPVQHLRGRAWHSWTTKHREKMKIPLELPISLKINEIIRRALERRMCVCVCMYLWFQVCVLNQVVTLGTLKSEESEEASRLLKLVQY